MHAHMVPDAVDCRIQASAPRRATGTLTIRWYPGRHDPGRHGIPDGTGLTRSTVALLRASSTRTWQLRDGSTVTCGIARRSPFPGRARCMRASRCRAVHAFELHGQCKAAAECGRGQRCGRVGSSRAGTMGASGPSLTEGFGCLGGKSNEPPAEMTAALHCSEMPSALPSTTTLKATKRSAEPNGATAKPELLARSDAHKCTKATPAATTRGARLGCGAVPHSECAFIRAAAADLHNVGDLSR
jgi:hypothetical protein